MPVDEKLVREKLYDDRVRPLLLAYAEKRGASEWNYEDAEQALASMFALLDEKDAANAFQRKCTHEALDKAHIYCAERDEALSRIAELEAAIGESVRRADLHWNAVRTVEPLRPFVKQPSDPLEEVCKELGIEPQAWMEASARHGLTITEVKG